MKIPEKSINEHVTVLVIDDDPMVRNACKRILADDGYTIAMAEDGTKGLEQVEMGVGDIVLVDLKMPGIDGMEVLKTIKGTYPDKPVIMITAFSTITTAVEAMKLGAADYVPKPFTPDELSIAVHKTVEKKKLLNEIGLLRNELHERYKIKNIIGISDSIQETFRLINRVSDTDSTVLISGESGTGKELVARAIYLQSSRKDRQFVAMDCSTLSTNLLESELFGHVRGAFTGATSHKAGVFEIANGGTLFLDEISNIALDIQAKLLRVLEEHEYKPVGGTDIRKTDIRLLAATNKDLKSLSQKGLFREDLYYRLNVFPINIPPLRERREDIPVLAIHFLKQFRKEMNKCTEGFSEDAMNLLLDYNWPGNVREMKNIIERLVISVDDSLIKSEHLSAIFGKQPPDKNQGIPQTKNELNKIKNAIRKKATSEIEKQFIMAALKRNKWNVSQAARETGYHRTNFHTLMRKYNIHVSNGKNE